MNREYDQKTQKDHAVQFENTLNTFFSNKDWHKSLDKLWFEIFNSYINRKLLSVHHKDATINAELHIKQFVERQAGITDEPINSNRFYGYVVMGAINFYARDYSRSIQNCEHAQKIQGSFERNASYLFAAFASFYLKIKEQNQFLQKIKQFSFKESQQMKFILYFLVVDLSARLNHERSFKILAEDEAYLIDFLMRLVQIFMKSRFRYLLPRNLDQYMKINLKISQHLSVVTDKFLNILQAKAKAACKELSLNLFIFLAQNIHYTRYWQKSLTTLKKCLELCEHTISDQQLVGRKQYCLILIVQALIKLEKLQQALIYANILLQDKGSGFGNYYRGVICIIQNKKEQALNYFKLSFEKQPTKQFLNALVEIYYENEQYSEAISFALQAQKLLSANQSFKELDQTKKLFKEFKDTKVPISYFKRRLQSDHQKIACVAELAKYARNNTKDKQICDNIIHESAKIKQQNCLTKFNISFYNYLTKNKENKHQYPRYIKKFLSEKDEELKRLHFNIIQSIFFLHQDPEAYGNLFGADTESLLYKGIINRIVRNFKGSYECYNQFVNSFIRLQPNEQLIDIFFRINQNVILKFSKSFRPLFNEFLILEMLNVDPESAIKCYQMLLKHSTAMYKAFLLEVSNKLQECIQKLKRLLFHLKKIFIQQKNIDKQQRIAFEGPNQQQIQIISDFLKEYCLNQPQQHLKVIKRKGMEYYETYSLQNSCGQQVRLQGYMRQSLKSGQIKYPQYLIKALFPQYPQNYDIKNGILKYVQANVTKYVIQGDIAQKLEQLMKKVADQPMYIYQQFTEQLSGLFNLKEHCSSVNSHIQFPEFWSQKSASQSLQSQQSMQAEANLMEGLTKLKRSCSSSCELTLNQKFDNEKQLIIQKINLGQNSQSSMSSNQNSYLSTLKGYSVSSYNQQSSGFSAQLINKLQQEKWYLKIYQAEYRKANFSERPLYSPAQQFIYTMNCSIIHKLSQQTFEYIARYQFSTINEQKLKKWPYFDNFSFNIQKGDDLQSSFLSMITKEWLIFKGEALVIEWIVCIAEAICELEKIGIYNADIHERNSIKVFEEGRNTFKMIDFDYAFPVKIQHSQSHPSLMRSIESLFDFWIKFGFKNHHTPSDKTDNSSMKTAYSSDKVPYEQSQIIKYIFKGADESIIQKLMEIRGSSDKADKMKIEQCLSQLQKFMRESHLQQFNDRVKQLLNEENIASAPPNSIQKETVQFILEQLAKLQENRDYQVFIGNVRGKTEATIGTTVRLVTYSKE